eukprot:PhM_4_TR2393/c0_g1_i1/m.61222/K18995/DHX29; ATP-dependent RNA helicase DHX29
MLRCALRRRGCATTANRGSVPIVLITTYSAQGVAPLLLDTSSTSSSLCFHHTHCHIGGGGLFHPTCVLRNRRVSNNTSYDQMVAQCRAVINKIMKDDEKAAGTSSSSSSPLLHVIYPLNQLEANVYEDVIAQAEAMQVVGDQSSDLRGAIVRIVARTLEPDTKAPVLVLERVPLSCPESMHILTAKGMFDAAVRTLDVGAVPEVMAGDRRHKPLQLPPLSQVNVETRRRDFHAVLQEIAKAVVRAPKRNPSSPFLYLDWEQLQQDVSVEMQDKLRALYGAKGVAFPLLCENMIRVMRSQRTGARGEMKLYANADGVWVYRTYDTMFQTVLTTALAREPGNAILWSGDENLAKRLPFTEEERAALAASFGDTGIIDRRSLHEHVRAYLSPPDTAQRSGGLLWDDTGIYLASVVEGSGAATPPVRTPCERAFATLHLLTVMVRAHPEGAVPLADAERILVGSVLPAKTNIADYLSQDPAMLKINSPTSEAFRLGVDSEHAVVLSGGKKKQQQATEPSSTPLSSKIISDLKSVAASPYNTKRFETRGSSRFSTPVVTPAAPTIAERHVVQILRDFGGVASLREVNRAATPEQRSYFTDLQTLVRGGMIRVRGDATMLWLVPSMAEHEEAEKVKRDVDVGMYDQLVQFLSHAVTTKSSGRARWRNIIENMSTSTRHQTLLPLLQSYSLELQRKQLTFTAFGGSVMPRLFDRSKDTALKSKLHCDAAGVCYRNQPPKFVDKEGNEVKDASPTHTVLKVPLDDHALTTGLKALESVASRLRALPPNNGYLRALMHSRQRMSGVDGGTYFKQLPLDPVSPPCPMATARRPALEIHPHEERVLADIRNNDIVILRGSTGCGKSTQVPQFILNELAAEQKRGRIVITQPRRIAALSLADRVKVERGRGDIGHWVRFDHTYTRSNCCVFVTTGILLSVLAANPELDGVTHLIIDEVHERNVQTDFILLLVKRLMAETRERHGGKHTFKLILMSATIDITSFQAFFEDVGTVGVCDVVVPRRFNIEIKSLEHVLKLLPNYTLSNSLRSEIEAHIMNRAEEDTAEEAEAKSGDQDDDEDVEPQKKPPLPNAVDLTKTSPALSPREADLLGNYFHQAPEDFFDADLVRDLILHIHESSLTRDPNDNAAVLVFLSGMGPISAVRTALLGSAHASKFRVCILHGMVPLDEQQRAFAAAPDGMRKIVLSTNIAETSVTIPDIVHVIDTGKVNGVVFDLKLKLSHLSTSNISQSCAIQRMGRAGRCQDGVVYRLYSSWQFDRLDNMLPPEMKQLPTEELCLKVLALRLGNVKEVLRCAMDPPTEEGIDHGLSVLRDLGALTPTTDTSEEDSEGGFSLKNLTPLGFRIAAMPCSPRVAKMVMLGQMLGVPVVAATLGAATEGRPLFPNKSPNHVEMKMRKSFVAAAARQTASDHAAMLGLMQMWDSHNDEDNATLRGTSRASSISPQALELCRTNHLSASAYREAASVRRVLLRSLHGIERARTESVVIPVAFDPRSVFTHLQCLGATCLHTGFVAHKSILLQSDRGKAVTASLNEMSTVKTKSLRALSKLRGAAVISYHTAQRVHKNNAIFDAAMSTLSAVLLLGPLDIPEHDSSGRHAVVCHTIRVIFEDKRQRQMLLAMRGLLSEIVEACASRPYFFDDRLAREAGEIMLALTREIDEDGAGVALPEYAPDTEELRNAVAKLCPIVHPATQVSSETTNSFGDGGGGGGGKHRHDRNNNKNNNNGGGGGEVPFWHRFLKKGGKKNRNRSNNQYNNKYNHNTSNRWDDGLADGGGHKGVSSGNSNFSTTSFTF